MQFLKKVIGTTFLLFVGLIVLGIVIGGDDRSTDATPTVAMTDEERAAEIAALEAEVKLVPVQEYDKNLDLYRKLQSLDSQNQTYQQKVAFYTAKRDEARDMKRNPERFVEITDFSWTKEAFGSVMQATFTIKNLLPVKVKDIEVKCTHSAPSGTVIDSNRRTIYEIIGEGQTRTFRDVNMGFIHSQANRSGCAVVDVTRVE